MGSVVRLDFECERICSFSVRTSLRVDHFASGSLWLDVYVLVDLPDFVDVLFYSGFSNTYCFTVVFHYFMCVCVCFFSSISAKRVLSTPTKLFRGAKNQGAEDVWEFQRPSSQLMGNISNAYLSLRINVR